MASVLLLLVAAAAGIVVLCTTRLCSIAVDGSTDRDQGLTSLVSISVSAAVVAGLGRAVAGTALKRPSTAEGTLLTAAVAAVLAMAVLAAARSSGGRSGVAVAAPAVLLAAIGYPMSWRLSGAAGSPSGLPKTAQLTVVAVGLFVAICVVVVSTHWLEPYSAVLAATGLVLIGSPFVPGLGASGGGALAWVSIPGAGRVQPGELGRVLLIVGVAGLVTRESHRLAAVGTRHGRFLAVRSLAVTAGVAAVGVALMAAERDMGPSLIMTVSVASVVWWASGRVRYLLLAVAALGLASEVIYPHLTYLQLRVAEWRDPLRLNPDGDVWQAARALEAVNWAGWIGPGLGSGPAQRTPGSIPTASSDYVLAQFGAEFGVLYVLLVLALLALWLGRCWRVALHSTAGFASVAAGGLALLLSVQTAVVTAGVAGLIPFTGLTTPLLSAGGSSVVAVATALALLVCTPHRTRSAVVPAATAVPGPAEPLSWPVPELSSMSGRAAGRPEPRDGFVARSAGLTGRTGGRARARSARRRTPMPLAAPPQPSVRRGLLTGAAATTAALIAVSATVAGMVDDSSILSAPSNPFPHWAAAQQRGRITTLSGVVLARTVDAGKFDQARRTYGAPGWPAGAIGSVTGWAVPLGSAQGVEGAWSGALMCGRIPESDDRVGSRGAALARGADVRGCRTADVAVTVDRAWQAAAYQALAGQIGAVVVLDVATGGVIAMADSPSVDPLRLTAGATPGEDFAQYATYLADPRDPLIPPALRRPTAPGSTFKTITAEAALAAGAAAPVPASAILQLPDGSSLGGPAGRCGGTIPEALAVSCNPAFAQFALRAGGKQIQLAAAQAGFGLRSLSGVPVGPAGIGAAGGVAPEGGGLSGAPKTDSTLLATTGIGQGQVLATPLHMAAVASVVAAGGLYRTPYLVADVHRGPDVLWRAVPAQVQAWPSASAHVIAEGMREVVTAGTARTLLTAPGRWAAKTGTAQIPGDQQAGWVIGYNTEPLSGRRVAVAVLVLPDAQLPMRRSADALRVLSAMTLAVSGSS